jgi:hypothetical protein
MTEPNGRAEILSGGPGEPADIRPASAWDDLPDDYVDAEVSEPAEPPATPGPWRAMLGGLFGPESLAITGLILAILPSMAFTVLTSLAAAMAQPENEFPDGTTTRNEEYATAFTGLSAGLALLGVAAGVFALRSGGSASRATRGMAGAAVLLGVLTAAAHLAIKAMGGSATFY